LGRFGAACFSATQSKPAGEPHQRWRRRLDRVAITHEQVIDFVPLLCLEQRCANDCDGRLGHITLVSVFGVAFGIKPVYRVDAVTAVGLERTGAPESTNPYETGWRPLGAERGSGSPPLYIMHEMVASSRCLRRAFERRSMDRFRRSDFRQPRRGAATRSSVGRALQYATLDGSTHRIGAAGAVPLRQIKGMLA
jgi:hypothetical protein